MTDRVRRPWLVIGLGLLVVVLAATTLYFGRDEYLQLAREHGETIGSQTTLDEKIGEGKLRLPDSALKASGIITAPLAAAEIEPALEVHGIVVDIAPLVEARGRYLTQSAELRTLRVAAAAAETEFRRADALFRDDRNVSERVMRQAESDWKTARERLAAAETAMRAQVESLRVDWGPALADMALNPGSSTFAPLIGRGEVLLQMTLPFDVEPLAGKRALLVAPAGGSAKSRALLLAAAPDTAAGTLGATYFYRAPAAGFRTGGRVLGYLAADEAKSEGVVLPESAVVWHAGRAWVYVRDEQDREVFEREPVSAERLVPGGWFDASGLEAGQEVVVTGAQLLLSEELEYQIRNENED